MKKRPGLAHLKINLKLGQIFQLICLTWEYIDNIKQKSDMKTYPLSKYLCFSMLSSYSILTGYISVLLLKSINIFWLIAVIVAQLVEWLLHTTEVRGSNPFIGKLFYGTFVCCQLYWKDENKEKEAANGPFLTKTFGYSLISNFSLIFLSAKQIVAVK